MDSAKTVFAGKWGGSSMCANPNQPVATNTCCPSGSTNAQISCIYHGEYVTYAKNEARCGSSGDVCAAGTVNVDNQDECSGQTGYNAGYPDNNHFQWTSGTCQVSHYFWL